MVGSNLSGIKHTNLERAVLSCSTVLAGKLHYATLHYFTIPLVVVQGVLVTGRIDGSYTLHVGGKWTFSEQLLAYCSLSEKVLLRGESDCCEQNLKQTSAQRLGS